MLPGIKKWLEEQGFGLEMRVAAAFRAAGFEVRQSSTYTDPETEKSREIDIIAASPTLSGADRIGFVVECKSSKKPWALLSSHDTLDGYNRLFAVGVLSGKAREVLAKDLERWFELLPWLRKPGAVAYGLRQAHTDNDNAFAAAMGVAKATNAWAGAPDTILHGRIVFAFPLIVVDAPIVQCSIDDDGEIRAEEVSEGEFLFSARIPQEFGACIRILHVSQVSAFARAAWVVAERIHAALSLEDKGV